MAASFKWLILGAWVLLNACSSQIAQPTPAELAELFPARKAKFGNRAVNYRVYVPHNRNVDERLPVLLYLHGADDRGSDNERQLSGLRQIIQAHPERFQMLIVFPQCEVNHFWDFEQLTAARIALNDAIDTFDGDETKVYVSGHSLGAYGAWSFAARNRYELAALVPISGRVLPRPQEREQLGDELKDLTDSSDPYDAIADRLSGLPIWAFHGTEDRVVPIAQARNMVEALTRSGNPNVKFSELKGVGHNSIDTVFQDPDLFEWLSRQHNPNRSYESVNVTDDVAYGSVFESIVYSDDLPFGEYGGFTSLTLSGVTIAPSKEAIDALRGTINSSVLKHFEENINVGQPLRESDYGVHFPLYWSKPNGSLLQLFEREMIRDPKLQGVIGVSSVGYDREHSRSLVYVEFVNSERQLRKKFCLINWIREGQGLQTSSVKWIAVDI